MIFDGLTGVGKLAVRHLDDIWAMAGRSAWFVGPSDTFRSTLPSPPVVQLRSTVCGPSEHVETTARISRPPKAVNKRNSVQYGNGRISPGGQYAM